ncbi:MAG: sugar phosphate isomerase/epimerase family protein [Planctomycetota bacterium]
MQPTTSRRTFVKTTLAAAAVAAAPQALAFAAAEPKRKFTMDLNPGGIGVRLPLPELLPLAAKYGYESVAPNPAFLEKLSETAMSELLGQLKQLNLVWGAAGLPVDFRKDDETFAKAIKGLPAAAAALQRAGGTRVSTWILPSHDTLTYVQNLRQHGARLREAAKVLADHGQRLGLEYVGPKQMLLRGRFSFVRTLAEMRDLLNEIGQPNVGVVLDSWHHWHAEENQEDLLTLKNEEVVACDLNDAPAGTPREQLPDSPRELPAATGVLDLKAFLTGLVKIGYDGPVRAEPFYPPLKTMSAEEAIATTAAAMKKAFALIE